MSLKFRSAFVPRETKAEVFNYEYHWKYLDESGKLKSDHVNQAEQIMSAEYMTSQQFVDAGGLGYGVDGDDLFMDTTEFPTDLGELLLYAKALNERIAEVASKQGEAVGEVKTDNVSREAEVGSDTSGGKQ